MRLRLSVLRQMGKERAIADGKIDGEWLELPDGYDLSNRPLWVRMVGVLSRPTDTGVGDTLARIFSWFGGNQYKRARKAIGRPCNCEKNRKLLNIRYPSVDTSH